MRWMRTTPFAVRFTRWYQAHVPVGEAPSTDDMQVGLKMMTEAYSAAVARAPEYRAPIATDYLASARFANDQVGQALDVATFYLNGRNVFALPSDLVALLAQTDLTGIRYDDLRLPFLGCYIAWGDALDAALPGPPNQIDGVYCHLLAEHPGGAPAGERQLRLAVTGKRLGAPTHDSSGWPWFHDLLYGCVFHPKPGDTLDSLIDRAVAANEIPMRPKATTPPDGMRVGTPHGVASVTSHEAETSEATSRSARDGFAPFRLAVSVAMNALCYLTALPELGPRVYPSDAPHALVKRSEGQGANAGPAKKAASRLLEGGYVPIRLVPFEATHETADGVSTGREVTPHWRRGHWRRQPFGEGRRQVRLQWIRPTLVRADRGPAVHGHVYHS